MVRLAEAGAFNWTGEKHDRRTAVWRAERAGQSPGPLFENVPDAYEIDESSPLISMTIDERLIADFFDYGIHDWTASDGISPRRDEESRYS